MAKYFLVLDYTQDGIPNYSETEILAANITEVMFIIRLHQLECIEIHKETTKPKEEKPKFE